MASDELSLSSLVGQQVFIKVPLWKQEKLMTVKLVAVDLGGVWIESNPLMEEFFEGTPHKMSSRSLQVFLPYAQILRFITSVEALGFLKK